MTDLIALKRLTKSDLGWFRSVFINRKLAGKQKGINLNAKVLEPMFEALTAQRAIYMPAKAAMKAAGGRKASRTAAYQSALAIALPNSSIKVLTTIYGPDFALPPMPLDRLIKFQDKNIRLNGKFVYDAPGETDRFDPPLQVGDLALMGFGGKETPTSVDVVLVSRSIASNADILRELDAQLKKGIKPPKKELKSPKPSRDSMARVDRADLKAIAEGIPLPVGHPVWQLLDDPDLAPMIEAAVAQGPATVARVWHQRTGRPMTATDLTGALERASKLGMDGEKVVERWLAGAATELGAAAAQSTAATTSVTHPYDFALLDGAGDEVARIEVKTTAGRWNTDFYMSRNELATAAASPIPYRIARVSELGATGSWLRLSEDLSAKAKEIKDAFPDDTAPGARVGSVMMTPDRLGVVWGTPIRLPPLVAIVTLPDPADADDDPVADVEEDEAEDTEEEEEEEDDGNDDGPDEE
jgi:hypothetical protein